MISLKLPATKFQQHAIYLFITAILFLLLFLYLKYFPSLEPPLDDPYIVLHNAQVLHQGYDINYPGVSALDGTTSLIHLALIYLLTFFLAPLAALTVVMWFAIFAYALGLLRLAFAYAASAIQAMMFVIIGLSVSYTIFQLLNGLETGLTLAALIWFFVLFTKPNHGIYRVLRMMMCGLFPFLRPELAIFSLLFFLYQSWNYWREKKSWVDFFKNTLRDAIVLFLTALPFLLWYKLSIGAFYPETMAAKQAFMAAQYCPISKKINIISFALGIFAHWTGWLCWLGMLILLLLTPFGRLAFLFFVGFLSFYFYYYPTGLVVNGSRYLYLTLPFFLYGMISCIRYPDSLIRFSANFILIATLSLAMVWLPKHWNFYLEARDFYTTRLTAVTHWSKENLPANSVLLIHDAGYLAFHSKFHLVDFVGLKTPSSIYYHKQLTLPSCGNLRIQAISFIIQKEHPQYLIVLQEWQRMFKITDGLQKLGWHLKLLWSTKDAYSIYKIIY